MKEVNARTTVFSTYRRPYVETTINIIRKLTRAWVAFGLSLGFLPARFAFTAFGFMAFDGFTGRESHEKPSKATSQVS